MKPAGSTIELSGGAELEGCVVGLAVVGDAGARAVLKVAPPGLMTKGVELVRRTAVIPAVRARLVAAGAFGRWTICFGCGGDGGGSKIGSPARVTDAFVACPPRATKVVMKGFLFFSTSRLRCA